MEMDQFVVGMINMIIDKDIVWKSWERKNFYCKFKKYYVQNAI